MNLLTKEIQDVLPPLYAQENAKDPIVYFVFYTPWAYWTWYALEGDVTEYEEGEDGKFHSDYIFFGWAEGDCGELGYFRLSELENLRGPLGMKVERRICFKPCRLSEAKRQEEDIRNQLTITMVDLP